MNLKENLYRCFDPKLKWYFLDNGLEFILYAKDRDTNDVFWLFERTNKFNELYESFKEKKRIGAIECGKEKDNRTVQGRYEKS